MLRDVAIKEQEVIFSVSPAATVASGGQRLVAIVVTGKPASFETHIRRASGCVVITAVCACRGADGGAAFGLIVVTAEAERAAEFVCQLTLRSGSAARTEHQEEAE